MMNETETVMKTVHATIVWSAFVLFMAMVSPNIFGQTAPSRLKGEAAPVAASPSPWRKRSR